MDLLYRLSSQSRHALIGEITSLLMCSSLHCQYQIDDIGRVILPAIHCNQFRLYHQQGQPIALITWAWMSDQVAHRYVHDAQTLRPQDWQSGNQLWVMDFCAPFGHARAIMHELKHKLYPTAIAKGLRVNAKGQCKGVRYYYGAKAKKKC